MPRARTTSDEEREVLPKRAPRRTVARAPRKKAVSTESVSVGPREVMVESVGSKRKAPTRPLESTSTVTGATKSRRKLYVVLGVVTLLVVGAIVFGYSDEGQINPASVISERNARLVAGEIEPDSENTGTPTETVIPVQNNLSALPDGGMIISESPPPTPAPAPFIASTTEATSTASSSPEAQTGTEPIEENSENTQNETEVGENPSTEETPIAQ